MEPTIPVVECFHSLQGEGAHTGRSAFFIRLASCNVGCSWCDTKISWSTENHPMKSVQELAKETAMAAAAGAAFVVLTGGEPLHHNLNPLCDAIRDLTRKYNNNHIPIHIETSGVNQISGQPNWITLSPKRHAPPRPELLASCQELKIIVHEKDDLIFAESITQQTISAKELINTSNISQGKLAEQPLLFLQPGWESANGQKLSFEYVKHNPQWRLSLQTHKWMGIR